MLTETAKDTGGDALSEPLVKAFASSHLAEFLFLFGRELDAEWIRPSPSSLR